MPYGREAVESGEITYRGLTYTYEIVHDDDARSPVEDMEDPGIWIHDNAQRDWSHVAIGGGIWRDMEDYEKYPNGVEEAYEAWADKRYDALKRQYMPDEATDFVRDSVIRRAWHESHGIGSVVEWFERETNGIAMVLHGFEHGMQSVSVNDYGDRWDSGAIGIVYMTPAVIRELMGWKRITKARRAKMREYMANDVEAIDNWLSGYVYGYVIYDEKGKEPMWGSRWGHHDDWKATYTIECAIEAIKGDIEHRYLDIDVARVTRIVADTGFMLGRMAMGRDENDGLVNARMQRMRRAVEGLPEWRRKEPLAVFDPAYEAAVTHPFLGANPSAWDSEVTTSYGSLG
jgi:hypothetical protein